MSDLKKAAQQALEALEALRKCITCWPDETWAPHEFAAMDRSSDAITALRTALAQQEEGRIEFNVKMTVCHTCGSTNGAHSHDCPVAKAALAQQEQDWEHPNGKDAAGDMFKMKMGTWRDVPVEMTDQERALRLAEYLDLPHIGQHKSAAELRRLHAENERLTNLCYDYTGQITALRAAEQMRTRIDAMKERKKNHE